ncbi:MAG: ABC transporter permease [Planctomycetaceae bacterium]|nr:ABC transporter permease [Planctomycetaceae bacterium]
MTEPTSVPAPTVEPTTLRWEPRDVAPIVTLVVLLLFFMAVAPDFRDTGTITRVLKQGAVLGIASVGLTFVLLCGEIDLAVGTIALGTACLCGVLFETPFAAGVGAKAPISFGMTLLVIVLPLVVSLAAGMISGSLTVLSRLPSFIITLSMMNIAQGMAKYITTSRKHEVPEILKLIGNAGIGLTNKISIPYSALLAGTIMILGHIVLKHTRFGRFVYMTGGNREAARLAGVRTSQIVTASLALCAVTAGLAGLVNAGRLGSVSLDQNADLLLNAVACVVLGGTSLFGGEGSMGRTLIGVLTFTMLQVGLADIKWVDEFMRTFLLGVVLLVALVLNGLLAQRRSVQ